MGCDIISVNQSLHYILANADAFFIDIKK